jgi:RNA polymerase sigma factor (sigma-70 family)
MLMGAFKELGEKCRQLVRLRYLQELSFKEIAGLLGTKEKTLAVQAGRCLRELKALYLKVEQGALS